MGREAAADPALWQTIDAILRSSGWRADLNRLARRAGYSRFHLSRLIHRTTGLPLTTYMAHLRIQEARRLLAITPMTISDVALAVGFTSLGTFGRQFGITTGLSPGAFRRFARGAVPRLALDPGAAEVSGTVTAPRSFVGSVHVGLFRTAGACGLPVAQATLEGPGPFSIRAVPPGWYHPFAVACCCHPSFAGDASGAWAAGAAPRVLAESGHVIACVQIRLEERLPPAAPVLAIFPKERNHGEAGPPGPGLNCGLGPLGQEGGRMTLGVASIVLYVSDMERAVDFYRKLLAADVAHRNPTVTTLVTGQVRLILHRDKLPVRAGVRGAMEWNLAVPDVGAFFAAMRGRGLEAEPPAPLPWGWVGFSLTDPDGNVVEIYETPQ